MIKLVQLKLRNFLTFGNYISTVNFTNPLMLVVGANACGKSAAVTDALCFALFNKPYRSLKKKEYLVNNLNKKGCYVSLEFEITGDGAYKIERGITPNIFNVYKDGVLLNQDASSKDYQARLENEIIRMSYNTFVQLVMIGKSTYVPFLKLTPADKRKFIDQVMGLGLFGVMQEKARLELNTTKIQMDKASTELQWSQDKVAMQQKHKATLEHMMTADSQIDDLKAQLTAILEILRTKPDLEKISALTTKMDTLKPNVSKLEYRIQELYSKTRFFEEHSECSQCHQAITDELKLPLIEQYKGEISKYESMLEKTRGLLGDTESELATLTRYKQAYDAAQQQAHILKSHLETAMKTDLKANVFALEKDLEELELKLKDLQGIHQIYLQHYTDYVIIHDLLKSGVVKNVILNNCRDILQVLTNKYLGIMGFKGRIKFESDFTETILVKNVEQTYLSFSEGQKIRLDLSIMLAWREIVRVHNKGHELNILIFDEVLDSSLDTSGVQMFIEIMQKLTGFNKVLISHSEKWTEYFEHVLQFSIHNGFSVIKAI